MVADPQVLENILTQVKELSPEYRLRLVQRIIQTLISPTSPLQPQPLRFGEFGGDEEAMSTLEDFATAYTIFFRTLLYGNGSLPSPTLAKLGFFSN